MPETGNFIFTQLSADALTDGRLFDGLSAGEFIDMHGRRVEFKPGELPAYLSNTLAAIQATKSESGEIVGLPIDARDHENGDGSGWIIGAELEGTRIRLKPLWTDLGADLIKRGIRRFFSATVDTVNKVILGGTLTNWPATRDPQGKIMLRPIELSQVPGTFQLAAATDDAEDSLNDQLDDVSAAFAEQFGGMYGGVCPDCGAMCGYGDKFCPGCGRPCTGCVLVDVFDDHVIAREAGDDDLYSVSYTRSGDANDTITFAARDQWKPVKQLYVEAAMKQLRRISRFLGFDKANAQNKPGEKPEPAAPVQSTGDDEMAIKLAELSAEDRAELVKLLAAQMTPAPAPALAPVVPAPAPATTAQSTGGWVPAAGTSAVDLSQLLGVQPLTEAGKTKLTELMAAQALHVQEQAALAFQAQMAQIQRDTAITELSMRITGGTPDAPRGVKGATAEELKRHLSALPAPEAKWFGDLLTGIVKDGLVEFTELGHSRKMLGTTELPAEVATALDKGEFKLADLSSPLLALGDLAQYDLSKWQGNGRN